GNLMIDLALAGAGSVATKLYRVIKGNQSVTRETLQEIAEEGNVTLRTDAPSQSPVADEVTTPVPSGNTTPDHAYNDLVAPASVTEDVPPVAPNVFPAQAEALKVPQ